MEDRREPKGTPLMMEMKGEVEPSTTAKFARLERTLGMILQNKIGKQKDGILLIRDLRQTL